MVKANKRRKKGKDRSSDAPADAAPRPGVPPSDPRPGTPAGQPGTPPPQPSRQLPDAPQREPSAPGQPSGSPPGPSPRPPGTPGQPPRPAPDAQPADAPPRQPQGAPRQPPGTPPTQPPHQPGTPPSQPPTQPPHQPGTPPSQPPRQPGTPPTQPPRQPGTPPPQPPRQPDVPPGAPPAGAPRQAAPPSTGTPSDPPRIGPPAPSSPSGSGAGQPAGQDPRPAPSGPANAPGAPGPGPAAPSARPGGPAAGGPPKPAEAPKGAEAPGPQSGAGPDARPQAPPATEEDAAAADAGSDAAPAAEAEATERPLDDKEEARTAKEALKAEKARQKVRAKAAKKTRKSAARAASGKATPIHSMQLDERMRRGDAEVRPIDLTFKRLLDVSIYTALALIIVVVVGRVGLGFSLGIQTLTYIETLVAAILVGAGFIFNQIRWRALRGSLGVKILEKWKADLQLTIVSVLALFTVIFILIIEVLALLVFTGVMGVGEAGSRFAGQFVLLAAIVLLVQVMAFVVRIYNLSSYKPHPRAVLASNILTPVAGFFMLLGVLLATGLPQRIGLMETIEVRQAVYVLTVGIGLEFLAMRIRLRLPSVYSLFMAAVEVSRRANEDMRQELNKRALRTYVFAILFVALSMAFAGSALTGNVALEGGRLAVALAIFYVGFALIMLGLILVRVFQSQHLRRAEAGDKDDLARLVGQRRRGADEIARIAIYSVSVFLSLVLLAGSVTIFATSEEVSTEVPVLDEDGEQVVERGEPQTRTELRSISIMGVPTTYGTDILLLAILVAAGPFGFFFNRELKRIEAIDEKFPDFLRDLAESARAGMTLPRALVSASHGTYGALTKDIHQMAAQVEWGVEFGEALQRFAERVKTPLIDRTVALVVEAQRAGGNVVDILTAASDDAREIKQIVAERTEQMKMYNVVVFIAFFVFITVVMILSAQFLPAFKEAVDAATAGGQTQDVGGIKLAPFDIEKFNDIFFHAALIQAIGGALVGGVMTRGHPVAGFNSMFIMMAAAWISFRVVLDVMLG